MTLASCGGARGVVRSVLGGALLFLGLGSVAHAAFIGLGQAGNYAVFGFDGAGNTDTDVSINSSTIVGSVAIGPNASGTAFSTQALSITGGSTTVSGQAFVQSPATFSNSSGNPPASATFTSLAQATLDALSASSDAASLSATQTFASGITAPTTVTGNGGLNVISTLKIDLGNTETLTLNGGANDFFIFNLTSGNDCKFVGALIALSGGVTANHVLFNVPGSGPDVVFNGGSGGNNWNGTILAPDRKYQFHDSILNGALIGGDDIAITSNGTVNFQPFVPPPGVPEPSTFVLIGLGGLGAVAMRRRMKR